MKRLARHVSPPHSCSYLPEQTAELVYELVATLTPEEYWQYVNAGWRRFGSALFRPQCRSCTACQPLRVLSDRFAPDRSQRRVERANGDLKLTIGPPTYDEETADLYLRHHQFNAANKGWPQPERDPFSSILGMVEGPLPVWQWSYFLDDRLVAVSYIDNLPDGFSGMYFFHDPELRERSLGTYIVLRLIRQAAALNLPYVYLGYYVQGCRSMEYKGRFKPNQILTAEGWQDFLC